MRLVATAKFITESH